MDPHTPQSASAADPLQDALTALGRLAAARAEPEADRIVKAGDRPLGLSPSTFRLWAKSGRLKAFVGPRGRYEAWLSDVRKAIEACPVEPRQVTAGAENATDVDPLDAALASGTVRR